VIRQISTRQPTRGTRGVAARLPLLVPPAERRKGNDAGVEPGVADLRDALDVAPALLAAQHHFVDPGPVQLLQLIESACRPLLQLLARPDHVQVTAVARVEGEREAEIALARDVPVAHVP
jgi:hypothetical protein